MSKWRQFTNGSPGYSECAFGVKTESSALVRGRLFLPGAAALRWKGTGTAVWKEDPPGPLLEAVSAFEPVTAAQWATWTCLTALSLELIRGHTRGNGCSIHEQPRQPITLERRKELLAENVAMYVAKGYRIEGRNDTVAVLATGRRINRMNWILDACLSFPVGCLLAPITAPIVALIEERRHVLTVDEYGEVTMRPL